MKLLRNLLCAATLAACLLPAATASALTYEQGFEDRLVAGGFSQPVAVDWAEDGTAFIAEKPGRVRVLAPGSDTPTLLLDISAHVNSYADRGLNGIAVDKSFETNGYLYLTYVYELSPLMEESAAPAVSRVTRVRVQPDGTLENPESPETVLVGSYTMGPCPDTPSNTVDCIPADEDGHTMGTVRAAEDGTLWIGTGDAAGYATVDMRALRALDERSLAGKILHVTRDGRGLAGHAFCSAEADLTLNCAKVHAKGFRNPFRFHLRPQGGLSVGDVGWNSREEVDLITEPGRSYGWPCYEGRIRTPGYRDLPECQPFYATEGTDQAERLADYDYDHSEGGAIVAGPTYESEQYPAGYRGTITFADYVNKKLQRLSFTEAGAPTVAPFATDWPSTDQSVVATDLEEGPGGDIHFISFSFATGEGELRRIVYTPGNASPTARAEATPRFGRQQVQFRGSGSSDPDGDPLTHDWDFGDGSPHSASPDPSHTYSGDGPYVARLTVSDGRGLTATDTVSVTPRSTPPVLEVQTPTAGALYRNGDSVALKASATDPEEGALPPSAIDWSVLQRHGEHNHFLRDIRGSADTSFTATRDHDADSHYEITATATDSTGLSTRKVVDVFPETTTALIDTTPGGATVSYGGRSGPAPFEQRTAIGYDTSVSATRAFGFAGRPFRFVGWSDGGTQVHNIRVPETGVRLTASYYEDKAALRSASASSVEGPAYDAGKALDGDPSTRWSSAFRDGEHWQVDLGRARRIDRVEIDWETAYASRYRVLTSPDGQAFTEAAVQEIGAPGEQTTVFAPHDARFVRVVGDRRATTFGVSFHEARVLGPPDPASPDTPEPPGPAQPPGPASPPGLPEEVSAYSRAVLGTPGLLALYGLGDRDLRAREARGRAGGRYVGAARRGPALLAGTRDAGARVFSGAKDGVALSPTPIGKPRALTVETWALPVGPARGRRHLVSLARTQESDGTALTVGGDGRLRFLVASGASRRKVVIGPRLRPRSVHHLVGTYDGNRVRLYVDAKLRVSARYSGGVRWRSGRKLAVGRLPGKRRGAPKPFLGRLDELALYRRALTAAQVRAHWAARVP